MLKEKLKKLTNNKAFHISMIIIIITVILFVFGIVVLKYNVEGETNMPFEIKKISVISSSEGVDKDINSESKWAFDINQNNDIYIYIEKNDDYKKQEVINSIVLDNFNVTKEKECGQIKIYKPDNTDTKLIFRNFEYNEVEKIEFIGDLNSNLKDLKISNQGDLIAFRYANNNVAEFISDEDEINHSELLKKSNLILDDLKATLSFDITIKLESGKEYKSQIDLQTPEGNLIDEGTTSREYTDLKDLIFKRVKN